MNWRKIRRNRSFVKEGRIWSIRWKDWPVREGWKDKGP